MSSCGEAGRLVSLASKTGVLPPVLGGVLGVQPKGIRTFREAKAKPARLSNKEVAGCATGSARLFGTQVMRAGFVAIYFGFM